MRAMIVALAVLAATPAAAQDKLFDPTQPTAVAAALREAGYKAELKTNSEGTPYIASAANGSAFSIEFYGCTAKTDCGSFQFYGWYKKEPLYTIAFVNEWNAKKRFLKLAIDSDGDLGMYMDVTALGKMTQAQFADWVDWYQTMDSDLTKFIKEKRGN